MNNLDKQYQDLLKDIINNGVTKSDRTGTGTLSVFGRQIRHKMSEGFPLLTTKKVAFKSVVTELLWFLSGDTHIKYLLDNNCNIWNGDFYKSYINEFGEEEPELLKLTPKELLEDLQSDPELFQIWGDLGPIYGKQWRDWDGIDQIGDLIHNLKTNPDSRRLMVSAWNVAELNDMVLPPCHYGFQVYTREEDGKRYISLMWNQRSVDTFLGLPFNIASYGLLLQMIADEVNMIPDELIGNLGDTHLYLNHIDQAKEQLSRGAYKLPTLFVRDGINSYMPGDVVLQDYNSHPAIKAPLSN